MTSRVQCPVNLSFRQWTSVTLTLTTQNSVLPEVQLAWKSVPFFSMRIFWRHPGKFPPRHFWPFCDICRLRRLRFVFIYEKSTRSTLPGGTYLDGDDWDARGETSKEPTWSWTSGWSLFCALNLILLNLKNQIIALGMRSFHVSIYIYIYFFFFGRDKLNQNFTASQLYSELIERLVLSNINVMRCSTRLEGNAMQFCAQSNTGPQ